MHLILFVGNLLVAQNDAGYLSAYIAGIILGNAELSNKKNLVHF